MTKLISAGLLMCRLQCNEPEFFLVHPGGPFFKNKENGVWTIPKGLPVENEDLLATALREFVEETGVSPVGPFHSIGDITQKGGKKVYCYTFIGTWESSAGIVSNLFKMEWPPRSGKYQEFPEQDRAEWMNFEKAKQSILSAQVPFLERALAIYQKLQFNK